MFLPFFQTLREEGVPVDGMSLHQLLNLGLVRVVDDLVYPLGHLYRHFFSTYLVEDGAVVDP